ncbi:MAG: hypothetical protein FWC27_01820, partial [Firmicutes bacterium]|nr:hypothetical protein [Bacillota bacterium]
MKSILKASLAAVLACVLALGLFACAPEEEKDQVAQTPFDTAKSDPLAYLNAVVPLLRGAESFVAETSYAMDDIEIGNDTLKAAKNVMKNNIIEYLNSSFTKDPEGFFTTPEEVLLGMIKREGAPADMAAQCPALFNPLQAGDLFDPAALEALIEGKIAGNLNKLEEDIGKGLVDTLRDEKGVSLKGGDGKPVAAKRAGGAQKRTHVLGQMNEVLLPGGMLAQIRINEVLEIKVAEKLRQLEADIEQGRNNAMKNKSAAEKRQYALDQLGENAVAEAAGLYQIDGYLSFAAAEKIYAPADKRDILAQLAIAEEYLRVEDYALEPAEFTLFVQVNKRMIDRDGAEKPVNDPALAEDMIKELRFELKSKLTATATGAG